MEGNIDVGNLLNNLGRFKPSNYDIDGLYSNYFPEIDSSYPGNTEDDNFEGRNNIFSNNFQGGSSSEENALNSLNQNSLSQWFSTFFIHRPILQSDITKRPPSMQINKND